MAVTLRVTLVAQDLGQLADQQAAIACVLAGDPDVGNVMAIRTPRWLPADALTIVGFSMNGKQEDRWGLLGLGQRSALSREPACKTCRLLAAVGRGGRRSESQP
jgi:hypothetical protein